MRSFTFLTFLLLSISSLFVLAASTGEWTIVQNGTTGITALEVILVSPTLILMMDRVLGDPLQIDGHQAWVELWNLETNTGFALNAITDTFCASGAILSNGTMVCGRYYFVEAEAEDWNVPRSASAVKPLNFPQTKPILQMVMVDRVSDCLGPAMRPMESEKAALFSKIQLRYTLL